MDRKKCEDSTHMLDFKYQKPEILDNSNSEASFAAQTPEKTNQTLVGKLKDGQVEFLQRCKEMEELFDAMTCSLRLLGLRKKLPTFHNVFTQVEVLTKRKFSYRHLAQLKFILPEAIQVDKILVHDMKTLCMTEDVTIILLFDVVQGHHEHSDFIALREVLSTKLINHFTQHPEACDIPEAILPELLKLNKYPALVETAGNLPEAGFPQPFKQISQTVVPEEVLPDSYLKCPPDTVTSELLTKSFHLNPSFRRHFSQKDINAEKDKTELLPSSLPLSPTKFSNLDDEDSKAVSTIESGGLNAKLYSDTDVDITLKQAKGSYGTSTKSASLDSIPVHPVSPQCCPSSMHSPSLQSKVAVSANSLIIETPAQSTPKRAMPNSEGKHEAMASQKHSSIHKPAKRTLNFSCLKDDDDSEGNKLLHHDTPMTPGGSSSWLQKVEESLGWITKDQNMSRSNSTDGQISGCLPDLVSLVHHIFQSVNYSPITKEELVYKITINSLDYVETREVEEQIEILEQLVPDWICRKLAPGGDALYNIKTMMDLDSIQARLASR
ncbi:hypothetical protein K2173_013830 [Erythroxylum novogranatense]|uniref:CDT1 Geminin-binding domain-containing protein n=1 Tax=Erythroxylum novogranatense TaxID=1862640 RepID=A0AAV8SD00_9ROSI|nr:hypothetical protein K2173_013830 [Erythroxylum novogranatense]